VPSIEWQNSLGGSGNDFGTAIIKSNDGGLIMVGSASSKDGDVTNNLGQSDYWVVKLKSDGTMQWQKSFGGSYAEGAYSVANTFDGGFIVAGNSASNDIDVSGNHGGFDYWIIKIDSIGNMQWQKCLGGIYSDYVKSIIQTFDSGYIVTGIGGENSGDITNNHGGYDYWVAKLDNEGNLKWENSYGGSKDEEPSSIIQTNDGGFVISGYAFSNDGDLNNNKGGSDVWIVKTDSVGDLQWQKNFGGSNGDNGASIKKTLDGGYIVAGYSASNDSDVTGSHGLSDVWVLKLDSVGNLQWQKCFGGSQDDWGVSIEVTSNMDYIVSGFTLSNDGDITGFHQGDLYFHDYWVVKVDLLGNIIWEKCLGGSGDDGPGNIIQLNDGGYAITGYTGSSDGDIIGYHGSGDAWVVKISNETGINIPNSNQNFSLYPNPSHDELSLSYFINQSTSLVIYDVIGRELQRTYLPPSKNNFKIDTRNFSPGVYIAALETKESRASKKFIVEKE
jgi:hypothetical protein